MGQILVSRLFILPLLPICALLGVLLIPRPISGGVGESAVITLVFPSGARGTGMGEVGTALADDEQVCFNNPAGLGIMQDRWRYGAFNAFYEQLLPEFRLPDLWHRHFAALWQPLSGEFGGFGIDVNFINMGTNEWTDQFGRSKGQSLSYETVVGLSWGMDPFDSGRHFFGASAKYIYSALAPGIGKGDEGIGRTFALDIGYLFQLSSKVRLGFTSMNMGPPIFYISRDQSDPIPFTLNAALAYKDTVTFKGLTIFDVACEFRASREFVKNYVDKRPDPFYKALITSSTDDPLEEEISEMQLNTGVDLTFFETFSLRSGFLYDYSGVRYELTTGLGLRLLKHFQFDWSYIYSPEGFLKNQLKKYDVHSDGATGARDGQMRLSLSIIKIGSWQVSDLLPFSLE